MTSPVAAAASLRSSYRQALRLIRAWPRDVGKRRLDLKPTPVLKKLMRSVVSTHPIRPVRPATPTPADESGTSGRKDVTPISQPNTPGASTPETTVDYALWVSVAEAEVKAMKRLLNSAARTQFPLSRELMQPTGNEGFYEKKVRQVATSNASGEVSFFQRLFGR